MSGGSTMKRGLADSKPHKLNAIERIDQLELQLADVIKQVNARFRAAQSELQKLASGANLNTHLLDAIVAMLGPVQVQGKLQEIQTENNENVIARNDAAISRDLEKGLKMTISKPEADSDLLVTSETDQDGKPTQPRRSYFMLGSCPKELRDKFMSIKVGESFSTDSLSLITLVEAYRTVPQGSPTEVTASAVVSSETGAQ